MPSILFFPPITSPTSLSFLPILPFRHIPFSHPFPNLTFLPFLPYFTFLTSFSYPFFSRETVTFWWSSDGPEDACDGRHRGHTVRPVPHLPLHLLYYTLLYFTYCCLCVAVDVIRTLSSPTLSDVIFVAFLIFFLWTGPTPSYTPHSPLTYPIPHPICPSIHPSIPQVHKRCTVARPPHHSTHCRDRHWRTHGRAECRC